MPKHLPFAGTTPYPEDEAKLMLALDEYHVKFSKAWIKQNPNYRIKWWLSILGMECGVRFNLAFKPYPWLCSSFPVAAFTIMNFCAIEFHVVWYASEIISVAYCTPGTVLFWWFCDLLKVQRINYQLTLSFLCRMLSGRWRNRSVKCLRENANSDSC